jgi:hypothetical protein
VSVLESAEHHSEKEIDEAAIKKVRLTAIGEGLIRRRADQAAKAEQSADDLEDAIIAEDKRLYLAASAEYVKAVRALTPKIAALVDVARTLHNEPHNRQHYRNNRSRERKEKPVHYDAIDVAVAFRLSEKHGEELQLLGAVEVGATAQGHVLIDRVTREIVPQ